MVTNLLATTGALAFHDNGDNVGGSMDIISFAISYGFVGFNPDHIAPDFLSSSSSSALGAYDGRIVKEVLSEFDLRANGHDGFDANGRLNQGPEYIYVSSRINS